MNICTPLKITKLSIPIKQIVLEVYCYNTFTCFISIIGISLKAATWLFSLLVSYLSLLYYYLIFFSIIYPKWYLNVLRRVNWMM